MPAYSSSSKAPGQAGFMCQPLWKNGSKSCLDFISCLHAGWLPVICTELKWLLDNRTTTRLQLSRKVWGRVYKISANWGLLAAEDSSWVAPGINVACPLAAAEFVPWLLEILDISLGYAGCLGQEAISNSNSTDSTSSTSTCRSSSESSSTTSSSGSSNSNDIARGLLRTLAATQRLLVHVLLALDMVCEAGSPLLDVLSKQVLTSPAVALAAEACFLGALQKVELKHNSSSDNSSSSSSSRRKSGTKEEKKGKATSSNQGSSSSFCTSQVSSQGNPFAELQLPSVAEVMGTVKPEVSALAACHALPEVKLGDEVANQMLAFLIERKAAAADGGLLQLLLVGVALMGKVGDGEKRLALMEALASAAGEAGK